MRTLTPQEINVDQVLIHLEPPLPTPAKGWKKRRR